MKKYMLFAISIFYYATIFAQVNFSATYNVIQPVILKGEANKEINFNLAFQGRIYSQENKVLLYLRPQYLEDYPDGKISVTYPGGISTYSFSKDSTYLPELYYTDSMQKWAMYNDVNPVLNEYITFKYFKRKANWKLLPEIKIINGLNCQHAKLYYNNSNNESDVFWDIWFSVDIPFQFFFGMENAPGLIIEAENRQANLSFVLDTLNTNVQISPDTFWPEIFVKGNFKDLDKERKTKSKKSKQQEIMDQ